jgi:predicted Zn-dependent peptidase
MPTEFQEHIFPNGMKLLHKKTFSPVVHQALIFKVGSRDESAEQQGMAHFVEHCLFKGTQKRKTFHILSRLDDVGGDLNAYTGKEETTLYAAVLRTDFKRAAELLADIGFQSVFPEKEIAKEVDVITDEIKAYKDSPSDHVFDLFDEYIFPNHPLGNNILGTEAHLRSFNKQSTLDFYRNNYMPSNAVVGISGSISFERVVRTWEAILGDFKGSGHSKERQNVGLYTPQQVRIPTPHIQSHLVIGNRAYGVREEKMLALLLANNILGGPGMNTRLNLRIREKFGLTYHLESFYTPYTDTGSWGIYLSTDPMQLDLVLSKVYKEMKDLRNNALGTIQLSKAKKQLQGQIAIGQDSPGSAVSGAARMWLNFDEIEPLELTMNRISEITASDILEVCNEVFLEKDLSQILLSGDSSEVN